MKVIYKYKNNSNLYIHMTNRCTNQCIFCDRGMLADDITGSAHGMISGEPAVEDIMRELITALSQSKPDELVICGLGEPTLRLDDVLMLIRKFKELDTEIPIRLNTNGHAFLLHPSADVVTKLQHVGLDKVSISLNATTSVEYDRICKPELKGDVFGSITKFVEECRDARIKTRITFVKEYCDEEEACQFADRLGVAMLIRPLMK